MKLTLPESAFFEVDGDSEMSEDRGPLRIGRFLGYWDDPAAALGQAAHGRFGIMSIVVPYQQDMTVIGLDRTPVVLSTSTVYHSTSISDLIVEQ